MYTRFSEFWRRHDLTILLAFYLFSLPIGNSLWLPLILMSGSGIVFLVRDMRRHQGLREFGYGWWIAAAIFLPALFSVFDSYDIERSMRFIAAFPLLFTVGYFVWRRIQQVSLLPLAWIMAMICVLWSGSIYIQFLVPDSWFGPAVGGRYQGVFGQDDMIAGYAMVPVLAFILFALFRHKPWRVVAICLFIAGAIFLSGNRAAWVSMLVILCALAVIAFISGGHLRARILGVSMVALLALGGSGYAVLHDSDLGARVERTFAFLSDPSFSSLDASSAGRGVIWKIALEIGADHWLNGTGVRSFRYVYPEYAAPEDRFVTKVEGDDGSHPLKGAMYAHQALLQSFADTGMTGLFGLLLIYALMLKGCLDSARSGNWFACGAGLAFWVAFFPLNTHLNFYGGYMMASFWIWIGLFLGLSRQGKVEAGVSND